MGGKANNKSVEDGFKKIYTFFANSGIAIAMSKFPSLSERKISEQRMLNILSLEEIITKDMDKFYLQSGNAISDYIKEDINTKIEEVGFKNVKSNSFFMTKVWSALK